MPSRTSSSSGRTSANSTSTAPRSSLRTACMRWRSESSRRLTVKCPGTADAVHRARYHSECASDGALDGVEDVVDLDSECRHGCDGHDRDQHQDQRVLHEALAGLVVL